MTFSSQGGIYSETTVNELVQSPIVRLAVWMQEGNGPKNTLYNITAKLCDLQGMVSKIPIFKTASQTLKTGNYTYACPMKEGVYIMDNMRIKTRNPMLAFFYRPNTVFAFDGGLYRVLKNGTTISLTTYKIIAKIVKFSCSKSSNLKS